MARAFTGAALTTRLGRAVGPQRAWRILQALYHLDASATVDLQRRRFLVQSGMLVAGLAALGLPNPWIHRRKVISLAAEGWAHYIDPQYGFAFEYPSNWELETQIQQPIPAVFDAAIIKRLRFPLPSFGVVDLDVWLSHGLDLHAWIEDYLTTRPESGLTSIANATIAGQPAVVFERSGESVGMVFAYFRYGDYVYRLQHMMPVNSPPIQAYWHILDTFTLPGKTALVAHIPQGLREESKRMTWSNISLVDLCCGYTCTGNIFPCCDKGNCTWWVSYKYCGHTFPFFGDAGDFWAEVPNFAYLYWSRQTGTPPMTHPSMANWKKATPYPTWGHVSYIASYGGGLTFHSTEMSCTGSNCAYQKDRNVDEPTWGYIFNYYF